MRKRRWLPEYRCEKMGMYIIEKIRWCTEPYPEKIVKAVLTTKATKKMKTEFLISRERLNTNKSYAVEERNVKMYIILKLRQLLQLINSDLVFINLFLRSLYTFKKRTHDSML